MQGPATVVDYSSHFWQLTPCMYMACDTTVALTELCLAFDHDINHDPCFLP